ncbi:sulfate adenylyltransferase subunit CysN [Sandarakinorhabdus sp. AAP62]|uniref:sulfate adenylyltransferase subunit CysN n=1 Tax=Sandarakinorhabdus sp. AAP62 TaxID=1248916 RepID=UPI0002E050F6|nr:sulfate adenylyltransferase subunit CysN [Sandarakinorhabdus sp. AAP62]
MATALNRDGVLRLITCGSVDDGKSTLIGRLLYDSQAIMDDTLNTLATDSRKHGTTGGEIDYALLLDGLEAEREQGITIDVAWRFFATPRRRFIIADTPGHEQYTRNMATGASTADLAIILVDASKGLLPQTRRHSFIASLMGIGHIVLAVNKMDLVGFDEARFRAIVAEYTTIAERLGFAGFTAIPMAARAGLNLASPAAEMAWYDGPTLIAHLESIELAATDASGPLRFPVQWVNRPDAHFRGYAGTIVAGQVKPGDPIVTARSGKASKVARIVTVDGDLAGAGPEAAVTLVLEDEIDISRGDMLVSPESRPAVAQQFAADLIWLDEDALKPGRSYLLKSGPLTTPASVTLLKHRIDITTLDERPARTLAMNEIGLANLETTAPLLFDPYTDCRDTGGFILIDRYTNNTVGAGMIRHALRRASNIHLQPMTVTQAQRSALNGHQPAVIWFTGLSGSGKSTIANLVEARLAALSCHTYALDGDNVRHGLNRDLGFTDADRVENIRRIGEVAKLMADAGLIVTCSFISPFRSEREMARALVGADRFIEVFVDTPLEVCQSRDPKGLYAKAASGELRNFTGIDSPYEAPEAPQLHIKTQEMSEADAAEAIITWLRARDIIG